MFYQGILKCKLVVSIKKWVDINEYKYVCIKMVHLNENSWMVMSNTPQIFLDGNEHYHPKIFTTLQNHNKSVK